MIELNVALLFQLVNFGILLLVLNFFLYKPLRKVLSERRQVIADAIEKGSSVDREVQAKMADYESRLQSARSEATAVRAEAIKQAQAEEAVLLGKARTEATNSLNSICEKVAREAADARALLQQQATALSSEICEKIMGRSL